MDRTTKLMQNIARFRLVTFDITDTLIRFSRPPAIQYAKTAAELGIRDIDQAALEKNFKQQFKAMRELYPNWGKKTPNFGWQQWWTQLVNNIFKSVKPDIDPAKTDELAQTLIHIYRTKECYSHIEGGLELVNNVRASGKIMGVITNFDPSIKTVLKNMNLKDKFDFIQTSYDADCEKPHKEIFDICLEKCSVCANEALHIGNMYELDYAGARKAGWSGLLITSNERDLAKTQPSQGYRSIKELLYALETTDIIW